MTPARWRRIEEIYHAAVEHDESGRASFLAEACGDDAELRSEVESLLEQEGAAHDLIDRPAWEFGHDMLATRQLELGTRLGPYEILESIGAGGMGQVYRAKDTRLARTVAIKVLPPGRLHGPEMKRRFSQEARAASALNHPNIVTIHDIGADGAVDYIVMEYVAGESLESKIRAGKLGFASALNYAGQIAGALAAAHSAGIVHRDIKPSNVMLTQGGTVKVLDFGLAKLIQDDPVGPDDPTQTRPGIVAGTVSYMSPEQAEGRQADGQTDIFSLGIVLYEMLSGKRPFDRQSAVATLNAIASEDPLPISVLDPAQPAEIDEVLAKSLAKESRERYQHAGDFELDLRRLARAWENRSLPSLRSYPVRRPPGTMIRWITISALVALIGGAAFWAGERRSGASADVASDVRITLFTADPGYEGEPTVAPDGQTVAYVSDRGGQLDIYVRQVSGGADIDLTKGHRDNVQPAYSPDGKQIAFVSSRGGPDIYYIGGYARMNGGEIWVMPALGGPARRVAPEGNYPSWTPDGNELVFVSGAWFRKGIYKCPAAGGEARRIPMDFPGERPAPRQLFRPTVSRDGRWILFEGDNIVYVVPSAGGAVRPLVGGNSPAWSAATDSIIYTSSDEGRNYSLSVAPFSTRRGDLSGPPAPLTIGRGRDLSAAVSRDGKLVAYAGLQETFNLERRPFDVETGVIQGDPRPLTTGTQAIQFAGFSPEGRSVVFDSDRGAGRHIWRIDSDGVAAPLTSDPAYRDGAPRWSPDGALIAFVRGPARTPTGDTAIWLMAGDGGAPRRILESAEVPTWLPHESAIVYFSHKDLQNWLLDLPSGQTRQVTRGKFVMPIKAVSPDGRWLAYQTTERGTIDVYTVPIDGGEARPVVVTPQQDYHPFFSPSGKWLYFQRDHKNLFRVPGPAQGWRPAEPARVTNFPESSLFLEDIQTSPDGREILYARGQVTGDIWLLRRK